MNDLHDTAATVDPTEVARFAAQAARWWDPEGDAKPLHRINPVRLRFIRERLARHFARIGNSMTPFNGLSLLDIGCGAGLVTEPMTRLGFRVTGIDAAGEMLAAARAHAADGNLGIDYRAEPAEALVERRAAFDVVLALEVVEHVADPDAFLATAARLVAPGGALILSTFNRTARSLALGIVAAEHLLRWVPRGTHDWRRFRRPSELASPLRRNGLAIRELAGMRYDPVRDRWDLSADIAVNYLLVASASPSLSA